MKEVNHKVQILFDSAKMVAPGMAWAGGGGGGGDVIIGIKKGRGTRVSAFPSRTPTL